MSDSQTSIGDAAASGVIILITLVAGILIGVFWDRTQNQVKDLKTVAAAATETTQQTTKNAGIALAEEGKLIDHAKDTHVAVDNAKQRIDALPKPAIQTCVPDLTGKGYVIVNAPDPDSYWRAFADGYNSVLERAEVGPESAAVHSVDSPGEVQSGSSESE